jgi:hypothetical protein
MHRNKLILINDVSLFRGEAWRGEGVGKDDNFLDTFSIFIFYNKELFYVRSFDQCKTQNTSQKQKQKTKFFLKLFVLKIIQIKLILIFFEKKPLNV